MSFSTFQRALTDLIASPELCLLARGNPELVLKNYELTPLEEKRIQTVLFQRGMSTNCTLYRANRVTPIYTLLPKTCFLLGKDLIQYLDFFWKSHKETSLLFKQEIEFFCNFIRSQIQSGKIKNPFIEEVLEFEQSVVTLGFIPRQRINDEIDEQLYNIDKFDVSLHPLVKVARFVHSPLELLSSLAAEKLPSEYMEAGDYYLLLDARKNALDLNLIDPELGKTIKEIDSGSMKNADVINESHLSLLVHSGIVRYLSPPGAN